jgi:hypothetical protein
MSLPVTFANLGLSGYPTNSIGEAEVPAALLDNNFVYLASTTVNTINQYTGNAIISAFGSLNVFTVSSAATVQLPIANTNNANPGILAISNSSSSTANLTIVSNGNSADTIVGATVMSPGSTMLFFSDGNKTWYNPNPQVLPVANGGTGSTSIGANGSVAISNGTNLTYVNPLPASSGGTGTSTIGSNNSIAVSNGTNLTYVNAPLPASLGGTGTTSIGAVGTKAVSNGSNLVYVNNTLVENTGGSSGNYTVPTFQGSRLFFFTGSSNATWTLPAANVVAAYTMQVIISNQSSYTLTLTSSSSIDGSTVILPQGMHCLVNDGGNAWHHLWYNQPKPVVSVTTINANTTAPAVVGWQVYSATASCTLTLPLANSYPAGSMVITSRNSTGSSGALTVTVQSGNTFDSGPSSINPAWVVMHTNDGNTKWIDLAWF